MLGSTTVTSFRWLTTWNKSSITPSWDPHNMADRVERQPWVVKDEYHEMHPKQGHCPWWCLPKVTVWKVRVLWTSEFYWLPSFHCKGLRDSCRDLCAQLMTRRNEIFVRIHFGRMDLLQHTVVSTMSPKHSNYYCKICPLINAIATAKLPYIWASDIVCCPHCEGTGFTLFIVIYQGMNGAFVKAYWTNWLSIK